MPQVPPELGCSTITFRAESLAGALGRIGELGFGEIDLGAIPAVVDHVPMPPSPQHRDQIVRAVRAAGLKVRTVNADPGPLSDPELDEEALGTTVTELSRLAAAFDAALIVPCGAPSREPIRDLDTDLELLAERLRVIAAMAAAHDVRLLVEAPHHHRLCHSLDRTRALLERVDADTAGVVLDVSHVVAGGGDEAAWATESADRTEHVHLRDAAPGNINLSIGNGQVDFAGLVDALAGSGYAGHYSLELETHDIAAHERPARTASARDLIADLIS